MYFENKSSLAPLTVGENDKIVPATKAELMNLRDDPKLSIIAGAQYAKRMYDHAIELQRKYGTEAIPKKLTDDERSYFIYICHHEGTSAYQFLRGTLSNEQSQDSLEKNTSKGEAAALIRQAGDNAQVAYRKWLMDMAKERFLPGNFRN